VHRDVSPHNVFVCYDGQVKVVDFGIAKAAGRACETRQGIVKGKVRYMAPEQAMGLALDRRADLFSVGVLLWEAITGLRFWGKFEDLEIARGLIANEFDPSPRSVDPTVPEELDRICRKALAHSAGDRYETAEAFQRDLEQFLGNVDTASLRRELGAVLTSLFARERAVLREIVERAGRENRETSPIAPGLLSTSHIASADGSMRPIAVDVPPERSRAPESAHSASVAAPVMPSGAPSVWSAIVFSAALLMATSGVLVLSSTTGQATRHAAHGARIELETVRTLTHLVPERVVREEVPQAAPTIVIREIQIARTAPATAPPAVAPPSAEPRASSANTKPAATSKGRAKLDQDDPWHAH